MLPLFFYWYLFLFTFFKARLLAHDGAGAETRPIHVDTTASIAHGDSNPTRAPQRRAASTNEVSTRTCIASSSFPDRRRDECHTTRRHINKIHTKMFATHEVSFPFTPIVVPVKFMVDMS